MTTALRPPKTLDDQSRGAANRLVSALTRLRGMDSDMPLQQVLTFLWVATHEGQSQRDMIRDLGFAVSTASRNVAALGPVHRKRKEGLGLIASNEDPMDNRVKVLMLSPKGRQIIEQMGATLS